MIFAHSIDRGLQPTSMYVAPPADCSITNFYD